MWEVFFVEQKQSQATELLSMLQSEVSTYKSILLYGFIDCFDLFSLTVLGHPPSPSIASCSLTASDRGTEVHLQWSSDYTRQNGVDNYHVLVEPSLTSCTLSLSEQALSPSANYSCSRLNENTQYYFSISAVNCGDQESISLNFTVIPQGIYYKLCYA